MHLCAGLCTCTDLFIYFWSLDLRVAPVRVNAVIPMFHTFAGLSPRSVSPLNAQNFLKTLFSDTALGYSNACRLCLGKMFFLICFDDLGDGCL